MCLLQGRCVLCLQKFVCVSPDRLRSAPAVEPLGALVPVANALVDAPNEDRAGCAIQQGSLFPDLLFRLPTFSQLDLQPLIGGRECLSPSLNRPFQLLQVPADLPGQRPLLRQCVSHLQCFDLVEGLFENEQLIGMSQFVRHLGPRVIGKRRADDNLQLGIHLPNPGCSLDSIPAGWHPDIHKRNRIRSSRFDRPFHQG